MIRFALDSPAKGPGYILVATVEKSDGTMPAICSKTLPDGRAAALQARELVDAAAALLESLPEHAEAFERLHDVIDSLPVAS
jgi:hypothetical protein